MPDRPAPPDDLGPPGSVRRNLAKQREYYGEPLGDRVRRLVVAFDVSQAQVAEVLGISAPMLSQVMSGRRQRIANPAVLARLVMAARARAASRAAAADVRGKSGGKKRGALPEKLLDCRGKDVENNELFLVEGDSAGGTAAMGRDGVTQAVLPLRGKILNTEGLSTGKVLKNAEVKSVVEALGAGVGANFDESRLRYGRVILLMDADSDGYHISTLLLTFFFRHMPRLVQSGKLFLAQPPLYRISVGNRTEYAMDDAAKEALLAEVPAGRKVEVLRFKGLGEMDSEQLRETTLDPDTRTLLRVDVESQFEADAAFTQLLGKDAGERYRLIMDSASLADDLDL